MRGDTFFKGTYNSVLDILAQARIGEPLPSENALASSLQASRTTVRKVLEGLDSRGILTGPPRSRVLSRRPAQADYYQQAETVATAAQVEKKFMEWMLRGDRKPGDTVNGLDLARQFGVSTNAVREYLNRFGRFGLIERRPNSSWIFRGFTREFALELFEIREIFEMRSALAFARQPESAPAWKTLGKLEAEHRELMLDLGSRYHDFSDLDDRFHRLINAASKNRFVLDFHDIISLIFHYHYQWSKARERERNEVAIAEHLDYIAALFSRDPARVEHACARHLSSARTTLLSSISDQ
jgi:DNA-binding GntR family transcriptional regulator